MATGEPSCREDPEALGLARARFRVCVGFLRETLIAPPPTPASRTSPRSSTLRCRRKRASPFIVHGAPFGDLPSNKRLDERGVLSSRPTLFPLLSPSFGALSAAHAMGVNPHRDIKPGQYFSWPRRLRCRHSEAPGLRNRQEPCGTMFETQTGHVIGTPGIHGPRASASTATAGPFTTSGASGPCSTAAFRAILLTWGNSVS